MDRLLMDCILLHTCSLYLFELLLIASKEAFYHICHFIVTFYTLLAAIELRNAHKIIQSQSESVMDGWLRFSFGHSEWGTGRLSLAR